MHYQDNDETAFYMAAIVVILTMTVTYAARSHGLAEWVMWSPDTAYCCGERDCQKVPASAVRETNGGWVIVETGQQFPDGHPDLHPSIDGDFWTCTPNPPNVRCLFVPPGAS